MVDVEPWIDSNLKWAEALENAAHLREYIVNMCEDFLRGHRQKIKVSFLSVFANLNSFCYMMLLLHEFLVS